MKLVKNSYYLINYNDSDPDCSFNGIARYVGISPLKNDGKDMLRFCRLEQTDNIFTMNFYREDIVKKVSKKEAKAALIKRLDEIKDNF